MLKKGIKAAILVAALILLAGCRVVWVDDTLAEVENNLKISTVNEVIQLDSSVRFDKKLVIRGQTNLPKGSIIHAGIKEDSHEPFKQVKNESAKPLEGFSLTGIGEISDDGTFLIVLKRKSIEEKYLLTVEFLPDLQPSSIQEKYGPAGENIGDSEGAFRYENDGNKYTGIIRYAHIPNTRGRMDLYPKPAK
ncbi:hypothetical protein ACOJQI_22405 [Bacillus salacetis]|uniref:hypothetical protein n=1 Tax=Bacillus salacetis TaxID=2315464 RepID=UPI003BA0FD8D